MKQTQLRYHAYSAEAHCDCGCDGAVVVDAAAERFVDERADVVLDTHLEAVRSRDASAVKTNHVARGVAIATAAAARHAQWYALQYVTHADVAVPKLQKTSSAASREP